MSRMEPAIREYLSKMRDEAFIYIKPGYTDTGANLELHPSISLQRVCAACAQEKGQGRADAVPREHAQLPAEVGTSRTGAGRG